LVEFAEIRAGRIYAQSGHDIRVYDRQLVLQEARVDPTEAAGISTSTIQPMIGSTTPSGAGHLRASTATEAPRQHADRDEARNFDGVMWWKDTVQIDKFHAHLDRNAGLIRLYSLVARTQF
jgi:hypothetical protein